MTMTTELLIILALLLVGHFLADYPLQGDFLAKGKNLAAPIPGVPWGWIMSAHAGIHAGFVGVITGSLWLGIAEFVVHFAIDCGKCKGRFGFNVDQWLHVACKLAWCVALVLMARMS